MPKIQYKYIVAIIYACVLFLDRLDITIVNITLPTLAHYFHIPITQTDWVMTIFLLALAISIPISGWLGDRFGIKKVFIIATSLFGLSTLLCALSPTIDLLILFRFLQGLGGGMLIPVGMTLVYNAFETHEYASITSFVFLPTLLAPAIAPALGGIITHFWGWRWVFLFSVPICLFAVILSIFSLKETREKITSALDISGFLFSAIGLISVLYGISLLGNIGFSLKAIACFLITLLFAYLFIKQESRTANPLIDIKFFKHKLFMQLNIAQFAFQICHFGSIFLVGMYLQESAKMPIMTAGLVMGMQAIGAIFVSRHSIKLFKRYGFTLPMSLGFMGIIIFTLAILFIRSPNQILLACIILFCRGLFSGLCGAPIQTAALLDFEKKDLSRASLLFTAGRQVSISLGIALSALLIAWNQGGFDYAFALIPIVALLGILITVQVDNQKILTKLKPQIQEGTLG